MRVFATYNIKGGVGKTASAVNLAFLSARQGVRTLLWDLDPQGAASFTFRIQPRPGTRAKRIVKGKVDPDSLIRGTDFEDLDLLPSDFSYRNLDLALERASRPTRALARLLQPLAGEYDHLFLDCPPSISLVSDSVFVAADALLIPTIPTTLSLRTLRQLREHLARTGPDRLALVPFFCMVDRRKALHRRICQQEDEEMLTTVIPYSSLVEKMGVFRAPLGAFARSSEPARAYESLWSEIRSRLGSEPP